MLLECIENHAQVDLLTDLGDLEKIEPEWTDLWRRTPDATPFQSPAWLIPWATHFTDGSLLSAALRQNSDLTVLIPAFVWRNGATNDRELVLLGTGISDYTDILADPAAGHAPIHAGLASIGASIAAGNVASGSREWDVLNCEALRSSSHLLDSASDAGLSARWTSDEAAGAPSGLWHSFDSPRPEQAQLDHARRIEPQAVCPVLDLAEPRGSLPAAVPVSQRQNLSYYRRRAERIGPVSIERANEDTLSSMLDDLFAFSTGRWHSLHRPSVLDDPVVRGFHRAAAQQLLRVGALRFYRMRIRGRTAAVAYAFASHGCTYYYMGAFNSEFASVSPGTLLIEHAIRAALEEGCRRFDFLRGQEHYKYLWGARDTQTYHLEWRR